MNSFHIASLSIAASLALLTKSVLAEPAPGVQSLIGTWTVVSWEQHKKDGATLRQFGASPQGVAIFDTSGHYVITVMRSDRARYASNALWQGTEAEYEATANGTQTYFGTYRINADDHSIAIHVEGSSFPNWNGTDQKRFVDIRDDQLTLTIRPPSGENVDVVWRRAK